MVTSKRTKKKAVLRYGLNYKLQCFYTQLCATISEQDARLIMMEMTMEIVEMILLIWSNIIRIYRYSVIVCGLWIISLELCCVHLISHKRATPLRIQWSGGCWVFRFS